MENSAKIGRPTKLTDDLQAEFTEIIRQGLPWKLACWHVGITEQTLHNWRNQGERDIEDGKEDTPAASFFVSVTRAAAKWALKQWNANLGSANGAEAQPTQWALLTRFPWLSPKRALEVSGPKGSPIQTVSEGDAIKQVRAIYGLDDGDGE